MPKSQRPNSYQSGSGKQNAAFWKVYVKRWRKSGLNRAEYCRRHTLSYDALTYWYSKIQEAGINSSRCSIVPVLSVKPQGQSRHSPIRIRFREHFIIETEVSPFFEGFWGGQPHFSSFKVPRRKNWHTKCIAHFMP